MTLRTCFGPRTRLVWSLLLAVLIVIGVSLLYSRWLVQRSQRFEMAQVALLTLDPDALRQHRRIAFFGSATETVTFALSPETETLGVGYAFSLLNCGNGTIRIAGNGQTINGVSTLVLPRKDQDGAVTIRLFKEANGQWFSLHGEMETCSGLTEESRP